MNAAQAHATALRLAKKCGGLCIVTKGSTVIRGYATPLKPNVEMYAALDLNTKVNVTLMWVPETKGTIAPKGGTFTWSTQKFTVAEPNPYDSDNTGAIYCELIGTR